MVAGALWDKNSGKGAGFALARYKRDGSLDKTFGTGGRVTTKFGSGGAAAAVAIQPNGKIVAAGSTASLTGAYPPGITLGDFALARYNPNGSLDTSFGTGGRVTSAFGWPAQAHAVALQPDGKIVAAGEGQTSTAWPLQYEFVVARYNPDGSPDAGFGSGGRVTTPFNPECECPPEGAVANAVAVQPSGKIIAAGEELNGEARYAFALARYNPNGSLDPSFGTGGTVTTSFGFAEPANGTSGDAAYSVGLQADGKIVAAGYSQFGPHTEQYLFALARYKANGTPDYSFGTDGTVNTSVATCLVPKVTGKKLDWYLEGTIKWAGCAVGKVTRVFSRTARKRYVVAQKPKAGRLRPEGSKVSLVVSKGRRR